MNDDVILHGHRAAAWALEHPWNLLPSMLSVVASILARRIGGDEVTRAEVEAALANRKNLPQPRQGTAAVIPIYGVLAPRMNMLSEMSGGTSYSRIGEELQKAVDDRTVRTIVFDIDSPGGNVAGNAELASQIMRARTKKPIIAQIQYTGASAAYQIAAAATEIVAAPSARIGSVGTYSLHDDMSEMLAKVGVKRTYLFAGEGKVEGNPAEPLSAAGRARIQKAVDEAYDQFVLNVVHGRGQGVSDEKVRTEWKAHVYGAAEAKAIGMIDKIATLEQTLDRLTESSDAKDSRAAHDLTPPRDTPQDVAHVSGQDRRAEAELERRAFVMLIH